MKKWKATVAINAVVVCFLAIGLLPAVSSAQDIHWSQFQSSPLNLNPSLSGFFNGDYRFVLNHRNQWKSVSTPYNTFSGSFDMVLNGTSPSRNRYSGGLLINSDKAGDSELGLFQAALSFGVLRAIGTDSIHFVSAGLQAGYVLRSINYSGLTFDEQYNGDVFDPGSGNSENFSGDNHGYADIGLGISWLVKTGDRFKAGAGISLQHINRPKDSFYDDASKLFPHLQADVKADFPLAGKFDLLPSVIYMNQGSFRELTGGTSLRIRLNEMPGRTYAFYLGAWLRKSDAFIASAGMDYNNLNVGVSYDFNTSSLERASNGRGGYELSLIYIIRKVKPIGIKPPCPLY
ncbi:MAG: PorP/SprF family type IX secretion system membrane protein [Bacteroidota bacterium]|nr:PorP/SprF family type IX secretion system membrane protein [Bacteroidota bacterium]